MPHIIILDEWISILQQLHDYTETIGDALANGEYDSDPKKKSDAEAIMADTATWIGDLDTANRTALDEVVGRAELFLGI